jgi:hypothetical protein
MLMAVKKKMEYLLSVNGPLETTGWAVSQLMIELRPSERPKYAQHTVLIYGGKNYIKAAEEAFHFLPSILLDGFGCPSEIFSRDKNPLCCHSDLS